MIIYSQFVATYYIAKTGFSRELPTRECMNKRFLLGFERYKDNNLRCVFLRINDGLRYENMSAD